MKTAIKITFILGLSIGINSCALFGGGKKCNDCPSWSNNTSSPEQEVKIEAESI